MFDFQRKTEIENFRMDPLSTTVCKFDKKGIKTELFDTEIRDDRSIIDRISSMRVILAQFMYNKNPSIGNKNFQMRA